MTTVPMMENLMADKTLLIDADILQYRCGFAADSQMRKRFRDENPDITEDELAEALAATDYVAYALGNVKSVLHEVMSKYGKSYRAFLTGSGNFREAEATLLPYKGNRDPSHKPKYYREIKDYLIDVWGAEVINGREADDALGCEQWKHRDKSTIIVTIDKDLDQIPGWHYNFSKDILYDVSYHDANRFFFRQMLEGDRVDNIPGIKGIGPKKADKILEDNPSLEKLRCAVVLKYKEQYGENWEQAYTEVAKLLWIQRVEGNDCPFLF
jgi:5'-3' exonuclease